MRSRWLSLDMLNDEALTLILIRLPSTYLHRYKCVSKRWFTLISDEYFTRRYIEFNKTPSQHDHFMIYSNPLSQFVVPDHPQLVQHYESAQNIADFSLKFLPIDRESKYYPKAIKICGASHGLLLCRTDLTIMYVCNPLTRQYLELPHMMEKVNPLAIGFTCYPVDPTSSEVEFVVFVVQNKIPFGRIKSFKTHVFLSKTGKWETFDVACPPHAPLLSFSVHSIVFCNGFFFWCPYSPQVSIVAYDPINQPNTCRFFQIPETLLPYPRSSQVQHIGVTEGCITIITICNSREQERGFFNVFELIDYDTGIFNLKYRVKQPRNFDATFRFLSRMNGEMVYFVNPTNKKLMMFNMNDGSQHPTLSLSSVCPKRNADDGISFTMTPWPTPIPKLQVPQKDRDVKQ